MYISLKACFVPKPVASVSLMRKARKEPTIERFLPFQAPTRNAVADNHFGLEVAHIHTTLLLEMKGFHIGCR